MLSDLDPMGELRVGGKASIHNMGQNAGGNVYDRSGSTVWMNVARFFLPKGETSKQSDQQHIHTSFRAERPDL